MLVETGIALGSEPLARRPPSAARRGSGCDHRGSLRGARRDRPGRSRSRAVQNDRYQPEAHRGDRRSAGRARHSRRSDQRCDAAPPARPPRAPTLGRLSAGPSTDDDVPRRAGSVARRRIRQPLSHREGGRPGLHRGRRGARAATCSTGCGRDRERAPVRVGAAVVATARVDDGGWECDRERDGPCRFAGTDRQASARADRLQTRLHRAANRRGDSPRRGKRP